MLGERTLQQNFAFTLGHRPARLSSRWYFLYWVVLSSSFCCHCFVFVFVFALLGFVFVQFYYDMMSLWYQPLNLTGVTSLSGYHRLFSMYWLLPSHDGVFYRRLPTTLHQTRSRESIAESLGLWMSCFLPICQIGSRLTHRSGSASPKQSHHNYEFLCGKVRMAQWYLYFTIRHS